MLIVPVCAGNATRTADYLVLKVGKMRRIASKCHRTALKTFRNHIKGWRVTAPRGYFNTVASLSRHPFADRCIACKSRAELNPAPKLGTENILLVVAMQKADIPGRFAKHFILWELIVSQPVDKIHKEIHGTDSILRIT